MSEAQIAQSHLTETLRTETQIVRGMERAMLHHDGGPGGWWCIATLVLMSQRYLNRCSSQLRLQSVDSK